MTELIILDNQEVELAALVDLDTFTPLLVAAAGPQRLTILEAFRDTTPFDLTVLSAESIRAAFQSFLSGLVDTPAAVPAVTEDQMGQSTGSAGDAQAPAPVQDTASAVGQPQPAPAPAESSQSEPLAMVKARCWNCEGVGNLSFGDDPPMPCNMCQGRGWINVPAEQAPAAP